MALSVSNMPRKFVFERDNQTPLNLPDMVDLSPEDVMNHYAPLYPELTTAVVEGPTLLEGVAEYRFVTKLGTKG